jgi:hypothetical protein
MPDEFAQVTIKLLCEEDGAWHRFRKMKIGEFLGSMTTIGTGLTQ